MHIVPQFHFAQTVHASPMQILACFFSMQLQVCLLHKEYDPLFAYPSLFDLFVEPESIFVCRARAVNDAPRVPTTRKLLMATADNKGYLPFVMVLLSQRRSYCFS
mmetsp:Transcript_3908/g.8836  ORF Transcript_3908/g.8836 Transcript_3908/m.8836 type:complete len:105 (-) Transcript_3908:639-953(-)